ncbi:MAG TPA: hypothetical protein DCZ92_02985 [Elusimicrobia bacterium]|nr:hypothetical protein [Elusimicrobiota bacterium]
MKAALLNPLSPYFERRRFARQSSAFPSGLGYIAGYLRQKGHTAAIYIPDTRSMPMKRVWARLEEFKPDVIGISAVTSNFMQAQEAAAEAKRRFGCLVIMGGPHPTALPRSTLESLPGLLDAVILGEGELPMAAIGEAFDKSGKVDFAGIPGAAFLKDGKYVETPRPEFIADLDSLPYPALDLLDGGFESRATGKILTSRGCPGQCTFCANIGLGRKFRPHSPERVVAEISHMVKEYGTRNFHIHDDCFTADPARVAKICDLILWKGLRINWDAAGRVNTLLDEELIIKMKKAGCSAMQLGIETGNQRINDLIKKGTTLEMAEKCCALLRKHGINCFNSFIIGNESETARTVDETIAFAKKLRATFSAFSILNPLPGTPIFDKYYKEFDRPDTDWSHWTDQWGTRPCAPRQTALSARQLQWLMVWAYVRYYINPTQLFRFLKFAVELTASEGKE